MKAHHVQRHAVFLFLTALAVDQIASADHSDPRVDALGRQIMKALQAKRVNCPESVVGNSIRSIFLCGRVPSVAKAAGESEKAIIDAVLMEQGGALAAPNRPSWQRQDNLLFRSYFLDKVPFQVQIDTKLDIVVLRYPQQFATCLDDDLPLATEEGDEVTYPVRIESSVVRPVYPEIARKARMEGTVILQCVIKKDGTVGEICVVDHSNKMFDAPAIDALRQWRYKPAEVDGQPLDVLMIVVVDFRLFFGPPDP